MTTTGSTLVLLSGSDVADIGSAIEFSGGRVLPAPITRWRGGEWDAMTYSDCRLAIVGVGLIGSDRRNVLAERSEILATLEDYDDDDDDDIKRTIKAIKAIPNESAPMSQPDAPTDQPQEREMKRKYRVMILGDTRPHRKYIKAQGFKWDGSCWSQPLCEAHALRLLDSASRKEAVKSFRYAVKNCRCVVVSYKSNGMPVMVEVHRSATYRDAPIRPHEDSVAYLESIGSRRADWSDGD